MEGTANVKDYEMDLNRVCWESRSFEVPALGNEEVGISEEKLAGQ